ncbi:Precorrin-6A reductase [compost metagenome]
MRALDAYPATPRCEVIGARGPFFIDDERQLFERRQIDVLVSKNSGSTATEPKLEVARERGVPVLVLKRPVLPQVDREFSTVADVLDAL